MTGKPTWHDKATFYDRLRQIDQEVDYAKKYVTAGDMDTARGYIDENRRSLILQPLAKDARAYMRQIRKDRAANDQAHDKGFIDTATLRANKSLLTTRENEVVQAFNTRWNQSLSAPDDAMGDE